MSQNSPTSHSQYKTKRQGFTLIELSIVLVIIGLIVGGVLVGQSLIEAAKLRSVITEKERWTTETMIFKLTYDALPGDFANAKTFFPACADNGNNSCNGNGNKKVDGETAPYYGETCRFWDHLTLAGLLTGQNITSVNNATGWCNPSNGASTKYSDNGVWHLLWGCSGGWPCQSYYWPNAKLGKSYFTLHSKDATDAAGNVMALAGGDGKSSGIIRPLNAMAVDTKIDDGKPFTGNVMAHSSLYNATDDGGYSAPGPAFNLYCTYSPSPWAAPVDYGNWFYYSGYESDEYGCRMIFAAGF